jgi:hypothetical protein
MYICIHIGHPTLRLVSSSAETHSKPEGRNEGKKDGRKEEKKEGRKERTKET